LSRRGISTISAAQKEIRSEKTSPEKKRRCIRKTAGELGKRALCGSERKRVDLAGKRETPIPPTIPKVEGQKGTTSLGGRGGGSIASLLLSNSLENQAWGKIWNKRSRRFSQKKKLA